MKIAKKITIYLSILCACSVIISGVYIARKSAEISEDAIYDRAIEQLISIREIKKSEIKNHFNTTATLLSTLAYDPSIQNAMRDFEQAYSSYPADIISLQNKQQLQQFYQTQFEPKYKDKNKIASVAELYPQLSPTSAGLQARYIANNHYPMGEKHLLDTDTLNNDYDKAHASYHPVLRHYLESFGFYDIFLIDNKSDIVYSVFKEVDFATNLEQGPFKTSGLASAYNTAKALNAGEVTLTDFSPYTPSFEQPASFLATPIFSGNEQLGVLVIQLPIDAINNIMTFDGRWDTAGLGNSGETYLVGMDLTLRSQSRFFLEDKNEYIKTLENNATPSYIIDNIDKKDTAIGYQLINTSSITLAKEGKTGSHAITDYRNVEVLSAYAPITLLNQHWIIVSEIDKAEALTDVTFLKSHLYKTVAFCTLVLLLLAAIISYFIGESIAEPIKTLSKKNYCH